MGMALRKDHDIAGAQARQRRTIQLHMTLTLGDQVEDHDSLGTGLEKGRREVSARRLVTPRRRETRIDEDGADQLHDA